MREGEMKERIRGLCAHSRALCFLFFPRGSARSTRTRSLKRLSIHLLG